MGKMGFGQKWLKWIKWCISTASFFVLVNGTPTDFFRSSKGLRQRDPLSPYLLLIAMKALSSLLVRAREGGFLSGFKVGGGGEGEEISHLLFANDTIVFWGAFVDQVTNLYWLLMWFEAISR